jgi:uncharacterized protein
MNNDFEITSENPFLNFRVRHLLLVGFLISLVTGFVLTLLSSLSGIDPNEPILAPIIYTLTFIWLCLWARQRLRHLKISFKPLIGHLPNHYPWLPTLAIVIAILLFSLGSGHLLFYSVSFFAPTLVESLLKQKTFLSDAETFAPLLHNLLAVIVVTVVAPVVEELIFRGIILHRWTAKWGVTPAVLISALLFAILHANIIGLFVFGVMMALLYIKTRTLIVPIVCHALNNLIAVGLELASLNSKTVETMTLLEQLHSYWWVGVVYIVLSAPWLITFIYKNWPKQSLGVPYFMNGSPNSSST